MKQLFVDHRVAETEEVALIQSRIGLSSEIVDSPRTVYQTVLSASDPIAEGKTTLFLTLNQGPFIKNCPGTRFYTCCGYHILHVGTYCTMDCAYCILQSYFHPPVLQFFVNYQDMLKELRVLFRQKKIIRLGTGEFTDSLIWENWTDMSSRLISTFSAQRQAVLELKTKTASIEQLKALDHRRKTIVAWSLNTRDMIQTQERGTASLSERLSAAAQCASWGYPVAFHFDPMIVYEGANEAYRDVVQEMFSHVSPKHIIWISVGSFRFMPDLKPIIQTRFPESKIVYGEFVPGMDGKMRYFKPLRMDLYRRFISWIRETAPNVTLYFCMEDDEIWQNCLGFIPRDRGGLSSMLDERARKICSLHP